jgi:hypothetical protein
MRCKWTGNLPINTMKLQQPKVLIQTNQVEATKGKNVVVGEAKPNLRGKELTRKVRRNIQDRHQSFWT